MSVLKRVGRASRRARPLVAAVGVAVLGLGLAASIATSGAGASAAASVPHSALINGDSVTTVDGITDSGGNPISLEQYAAQQAGFTVTVVDGATWDAMSAADFAKYQVLIIGDPVCNYTPDSAVSNASTWAPVVMGTSGGATTVGNRTLVGTDPEYHYIYGGGGAPPQTGGDPSSAGAEHLVQDGIAYAGGVSGATGVYFDTSCADPGSDLAVLNSLSSAGSGFSEDTTPPCGGSVQLIASNSVFATLSDSDIQGWSCSDHLTFPTYPTDWQPLAVATDTSSTPTCGTDPDAGTTACGESYVLVAGRGIVVSAPDLSLTPATSMDPAGGDHTVTATVTQDGSPVVGQSVSFEVTGQNAGVTGTCAPADCKTDGSGKVTFTYHDANGAGDDTINASVTLGSTTEHATASETWTAGSGNQPPMVDAGPAVSGLVNTPIALSGSASDPDSDPLTILWTGPAACTFADPTDPATSVTCTGTGHFTLTLTASDGVNAPVSDTTEAVVTRASGSPSCDGLSPTSGVTSTYDASTGVTTITGTRGNDVIIGTSGPDMIKGGNGNDVICAGAGNDVIQGQTGDDTVFGQGGDDSLIGGQGNDHLIGGAGRDSLKGQAGDDTLYGDEGNDHEHGGNGDDALYGGAGNDRLLGGPGTNKLVGGGGNDVCGAEDDGPDTYKGCETKVGDL